MMPHEMQMYLDSCEGSERGKVLKVLAELTQRSGFSGALNTVGEAIRHKANDPDSLMSLYRRIYSDVPQLPPIEITTPLVGTKIINIKSSSDLSSYDAALKKRGGAVNG